jgi:Glycosyltransferase family 87
VAGPAWAQSDSSLVPRAIPAPSAKAKPFGFTVTAGEAVRLAGRVPEVARQRAEHGPLTPSVGVPNYLGDPPRWEVGFARAGGERVVEVHVQGRGGRVLEVWTGPQVDNLLARGYEPSMGGRLLNAPYVWLPLCLLFIAPFLDPRRPLRILHLDLLMMLGFGVSQLFLNRGEIELSVPLAYPFLAYLLARMLWIGFRPRGGAGPLVPVVPVGVLAVALVLLVGFRVALNVADSSVIDVGYASVVGADRIAHDEELYTDNEFHGDAYGPVNYVAYLPFEALFPWSGEWDDVPAAHAAALAFDLLTLLGLFLLGRRLRPGRAGTQVGIALAFAWAAYPYSTYVLQSNTNDGLVAMLIVYSLLALSSPPGRGLLVGVGAAAKFAPLALVPLLAAGRGERDLGSLLRFGAALGAVLLLSAVAYMPDGGPSELWNATLGFQLGRESVFSLWGLHPSLEPLQVVAKVGVVSLALALFALPARRDLRQVAALGAAVLVGLQIAATHWFYFYVVWFAPLCLAALFAGYAVQVRERWTNVGASRRAFSKGAPGASR